ncbi:dTTP/UTP pyrophosphatase [Campylobacter majalis]|uniref:Nucleoside triphosphate pyrophosphatase n=1 Tax=Campylobacter majalis TaxID=2790656 RepID=A0ABN7K5B7_9BACT|nr:septum formation inhibitor Maf [Campylobacter majalis]CAD7287577.1 dTTP/UTP pyrophosphatase [Campylobacter majalis]
MIILASSSATRAKILQDSGIDFQQISFDFDESMIDKNQAPNKYVLNVVRSKKEQFFKAHNQYKNVLFADSCVVCDGKILGKARDENHARKLIKMQSNNTASVVTAMIYIGDYELISVSETKFRFSEFKDSDIKEFIRSGECMGKAGAMMIEGFNKKYIISQQGTTQNAMGLDVRILKAFL